jgi:putative transposase
VFHGCVSGAYLDRVNEGRTDETRSAAPAWRWDSSPKPPAGRPPRRKPIELFMEAVLWLARTGSPWRDLPSLFGIWNGVFVRFSRWSKDGVWDRLFAAMADAPDFEYVMIDSTIVRAHQHAAGKKDPMGK